MIPGASDSALHRKLLVSVNNAQPERKILVSVRTEASAQLLIRHIRMPD